MIDWKLALSTATRLTKPGPEMEAAEVAEAVAELREGAARSEGPVREFSRLHATSATAPVLVVDRPRWIEANLDTFRVLMDPVMDKLVEADKMPSGLGRTVGSKVGGAEVGALMSFMSSKVLGQFDPFWNGPNGEGGRLLLVAPNIVQAERQLGRRSTRLPTLGVPPRGDPSGAVHRRRVDARPHAVTARRVHRRHRSRLGGAVVDGQRLVQRGRQDRPRRVRDLDQRAVPEPAPARDRRPAHRHHVAARGSRRCRHGRCRARGDPERRGDPAQVQPAPQGRRQPRQAAAPPARPRRQDAPVQATAPRSSTP